MDGNWPVIPTITTQAGDTLAVDTCDQDGRWFDAGTVFRTTRLGFSRSQRAYFQEVVVGGKVRRFLRFKETAAGYGHPGLVRADGPPGGR